VYLEKDRIEVEGKQIGATTPVYLMLNKPRGVITTASDELGRETVYSFLDPALPFVAPVGRLDKASEGLLLLTNDSEWAQRVLNPESHVDKIYHVQIAGGADDALLALLRAGVLEDGERLRVKEVQRLRAGAKNSWLEVHLDEGRNRQIRRMLQACEVEVLRLVRVAIGPLALGTLAKGATRFLNPEEKRALDVALRTSSQAHGTSRLRSPARSAKRQA